MRSKLLPFSSADDVDQTKRQGYRKEAIIEM